MALELATASAVVAWTGASTAVATTVIGAVEDRIANWCNRMTVDGETVWGTATRTEYIDGELSDGVLLKWTPVTAITSVTLISGNTTTSAYTLTDLTLDGIEIASLTAANSGRVGLLALRSGIAMWDSDYLGVRRARVSMPNFGSGRQRIKVVYTGGYTTGCPIPEDLKLAALTMCKNIVDAKAVSAGLKSESLGNYSYTNADAADTAASAASMGSVESLLQPYRSYANIL